MAHNACALLRSHTSFCLLTLLLLVRAPASWAAVVRVDINSPGTVHDGQSWGTAFQTVAAGLSAATGGGEVWVAAGTYQENISVPEGVALYGGFAATETDRDQRDFRANPTTLNGGAGSLDTVLCQAKNIVVDGFAIRNGRNGVNVTTGTATLRHNTIAGASYWGVAVAYAGTVVMNSNLVRGGAKCGVDISGGAATLINNTVYGNGNHGVHCFSGGRASLTNNVIAYNSGCGVYNSSSTIETFSHNDVYANPGGPYQGFTAPADQGNLTVSPLLADVPNGDYRLLTGSPCINAGYDSAVAAGDTDLDGKPRIIGAHVDIGAYEYGTVGPLPFGLSDVTKCLAIASGFAPSTLEDLGRLNVEPGETLLDLYDAVRIARKVAGLDPNP